MKHLFTLSLLFLGILITQAQFTVATQEGTEITDGIVFTYSDIGTIADPNGVDLTFKITNTGASEIDMRLEYVSMINGDGDGTLLCIFGSCLAPGGPNVGDIFPLNGTNSFTLIGAGETTGYGDHFYNFDAGDGTNYPLDYVFKFFEVDGSGNEIGVPITFTYRYDGTASVEDFAQVGFKLYPTVSSDFVNLEVNESVSVQLINIQGQLIKQYQFNSGKHTIDVSSFAKQLYYLKLSNSQGQQSLSKIIVN